MTAQLYGYNPPFIGGPQNIMSRQEDAQLIRNDILQLLLTVPGERVMRPTFGVNLRNAVFEPSDAVTVSGLELEIRRSIEQHDPRVRVVNAEILTDEDNNGMLVRVNVVLHNNPLEVIDVEQFIGFANGP